MPPESDLCFAAAFAPALLDPLRPAPEIVTGPNDKGPGKRYDVYRNNVTVSLIDALAAIYPAVQRITGTDFFRAMARFHVRQTPPISPLLFDYGRDFPAFIAQYEHAQMMPWLADVARIERAWLDAYHAPPTPHHYRRRSLPRLRRSGWAISSSYRTRQRESCGRNSRR
jgi:hypothetical protein